MNHAVANKFLDTITGELRMQGIEVKSREFYPKDKIKMLVRKDGIEAIVFVPANNRHDKGDWLSAAVSSVRRTLAQRGVMFPKANVAFLVKPPPAEDSPSQDAPFPGPAPIDAQPKTVLKTQHKTKKFLAPLVKAEAYAMYKSGAATRAELAKAYDVSETSIGNIIRLGDSGQLPPLPATPPVAPEPTPEPPPVETVSTTTLHVDPRPLRTKADLLNPKVLSIAQRANGLLDLLAELKKDGAEVGVDVDYRLKVEL